MITNFDDRIKRLNQLIFQAQMNDVRNVNGLIIMRNNEINAKKKFMEELKCKN